MALSQILFGVWPTGDYSDFGVYYNKAGDTLSVKPVWHVLF